MDDRQEHGPQGVLESAFDFMQALSGRPKTTPTPSAVILNEVKDPETRLDSSSPVLLRMTKSRHDPYAFDNPDLEQPDALETYENTYGKKADPTLRGVLTDKTHPLYGRAMRNRSRLGAKAFNRQTPQSLSGAQGSRPGTSLLF